MNPKNIVFAIDSFKGSLSSPEAGQAAALGMKRVFPDCDMVVSPLADGGEGTLGALVDGLHGEYVTLDVHDPLGRVITARYGIAGGSAVIEMAAAAGITLLTRDELNPLAASTYGVGEMIADAIKRGIRRFIIAIGGSATNDGGAGMLEALGFRFLDSEKNPIRRGCEGLSELVSVEVPELPELDIKVACDVKNPLCGQNGCSFVFAPQKGARPGDLARMDGWLGKYAELMRGHFPGCDPDSEGCGAAGGLGFALKCLGAELTPGAALVIGATGLEERIKHADLVVTGEGRLDSQTAMGKAPSVVARLAGKYSKPCVAFSGVVGQGAEICNQVGIDAFFPILRRICGEDEAMDKRVAAENLSATAEQAARLLAI